MPSKLEIEEAPGYPAAADQIKQCPIDFTSQVIGKKFASVILRNMIYLNQKRFNEFLAIKGINPKTLSLRLKEMQRNGIIDRKVYDETPIRIEYSLTEKGRALRPVLEQMMAFSMRYYSKEIFKDGRPRTVPEFFGSDPQKLIIRE